MKILYIAPYAPGHIRVRPFHFLSHLLRSGHAVTVAYPLSRTDRQSRVAELAEQGAAVVTAPASAWSRMTGPVEALLQRRPLQASYVWSSLLAQRILTEVKRDPPDVVHVEHLRAVEYARYLNRSDLGRSWATVWDSVDCISSLLVETRLHSRSRLWRWASGLDLNPVRDYERWAVRHFDRVFCASERDCQALRSAAEGRAAVGPSVLNPGVDLEAFPFAEPVERRQSLVFSGAMGYHANDTAARHLLEQIMPRVWARQPGVEVVIVGPHASRPLRRIAACCGGTVRLTGWVHRVHPHLTQSAVAAIPMRYGAGVQNKLLEAMASGTPVITDPRTASSVAAVPGEDLLTAESDQAFADQILALLNDPSLRLRLAASARRHVERRFSWLVVGQDLERHYRQVIAARL